MLQIGRILIENAIVHTAAGTTISISIGRRPHRGSLVVDRRRPRHSAESRQPIFDRFYRLDGIVASGSGLGLAIARELAELMDGRIELESRPGRTRFTLVLPRRRGRPGTAALGPARTGGGSHRRTCLHPRGVRPAPSSRSPCLLRSPARGGYSCRRGSAGPSALPGRLARPARALVADGAPSWSRSRSFAERSTRRGSSGTLPRGRDGVLVFPRQADGAYLRKDRDSWSPQRDRAHRRACDLSADTRRRSGGPPARSYLQFTDGDRVRRPHRRLGSVDDVGFPGAAEAHLLGPCHSASSSSLSVGAPVATIGSPFGTRTSLSVAWSPERPGDPLLTADYDLFDAIQTDAPINRGDWGGR